MKPFQERLTEQMDRAGVTPQALADCLGVNPATVYKWRSGEVTPRPYRIEPSAECLGVHPTELARAIYMDTSKRIQPVRPPSTAELLRRIEALEERFRQLHPESE